MGHLFMIISSQRADSLFFHGLKKETTRPEIKYGTNATKRGENVIENAPGVKLTGENVNENRVDVNENGFGVV